MACWKGMMPKFGFLRRAGTCALCVHMWHIRHIGKIWGKNSKFSNFFGLRKFFKKFSKIVFRQKSAQKHLISITCSFEQNRRKIIDFRAFWNFSNFGNLEKKLAKLKIGAKLKIFKIFWASKIFQNFFSRYSVSKNRQRNISFRSRARLGKIEEK